MSNVYGDVHHFHDASEGVNGDEEEGVSLEECVVKPKHGAE